MFVMDRNRHWKRVLLTLAAPSELVGLYTRKKDVRGGDGGGGMPYLNLEPISYS